MTFRGFASRGLKTIMIASLATGLALGLASSIGCSHNSQKTHMSGKKGGGGYHKKGTQSATKKDHQNRKDCKKMLP